MKYLIKLESFTESKTYIKTFEKINIGSPKKGDWVICNEESNLKNFLNNNIGFCYGYKERDEYKYRVGYPDNIPRNFENKFNRTLYNGENLMARIFSKSEILYWSKDKNELEAILASNKYNL